MGRLGQLNRSEHAIAVYDEVVSRFRERKELPLAEQVAAAELGIILTIANTEGTAQARERARQFVEKSSS